MDEEALKTAMLMNLVATACGADGKTKSDSETAIVNAMLEAFTDLAKPDKKPKKGNTTKYDSLMYAEFVDGLFDKIKDKIVKKGAQYTTNDPVLGAVIVQTERNVGGSRRPITRNDVLHTILTLADKHQVALLQHGVSAKDVEDRLTDLIVYDIMALYLMSNKAKEYYRFNA